LIRRGGGKVAIAMEGEGQFEDDLAKTSEGDLKVGD